VNKPGPKPSYELSWAKGQRELLSSGYDHLTTSEDPLMPVFLMPFHFGDRQSFSPINALKALLKFILKALVEFVKKRILSIVWGWAIWAFCIAFVVVVAVGLVVWYFVGR
jgi:hypothetical protein